MTAPRLLAIDLDGTLLRTDGTVSDRSHQALAKARGGGIVVLLATARPPRNVLLLLEALDLLGPAVCISGALVHDFACGKTLRHTPLAAEIAGRVVEQGRAKMPGITFAAEIGWRFHHEPDYTPSHRPLSDAVCADAKNWINEPVTKLLARHPEAGAEEIAAALEAIVDQQALVTHSGDRFAEVLAKDATKAAAVAFVCERARIEPGEVVAFGDMPIDLPIFGWAGTSVAVANAAPEVLRAATRITASNDEDGVAMEIERIMETQ